MEWVSVFRAFVAIAVLSAAGVDVAAQPAAAPAAEYQPEVGQAGKDVVWVPTPQALVDTMLDMAKVTSRDFLIDLGSGDGRTVITAAKRGARALGIEYNPDMVELAKRNAASEGVADRARFIKQDLFESDFSQADAITMFLLPSINLKLMPKILALEPGTRIVSNSFKMGDWQPDETRMLNQDQDCGSSWCTAHLWIVPARVEGTHRVPQGELVLKQQYQMVSGTLRTNGKTVPVEGKVVGRDVELSAGTDRLRGRVEDGRLVVQR